MDVKDQNASTEQKEKLKDLHNEEQKKFRISSYIIFGGICLAITFLLRLKTFNFVGTYRPLLINIFFAGASSFGILICHVLSAR